MSRPGKLLRWAMRPDAPGAAEERIRYRAAAEQAVAETLARFNGITPENALEAIAWQEERIRELTGTARK